MGATTRTAVRSLGWLLIAAGVVVALYLVYALYWTGRTTEAAQERLLEGFAQPLAAEPFELEVGELEPLPSEAPVAPPPPIDVAVGDAVAVMRFLRPSSGEPVVVQDPLVVVEGVTVDALKTGPGRYPGAADPGHPGNFAVAGHRTTYGQPFWNLDQLQEGDEIHVTDRAGTTWVYAFRQQRIVPPSDISVLADDPIDAGAPVLTLTTCHPRWSQQERLIVHAELVGQQVAAS